MSTQRRILCSAATKAAAITATDEYAGFTAGWSTNAIDNGDGGLCGDGEPTHFIAAWPMSEALMVEFEGLAAPTLAEIGATIEGVLRLWVMDEMEESRDDFANRVGCWPVC